MLTARIQDDHRNTTTFLVVQSAANDFLDRHPSRLIFKLNAPAGSNTLSQLVDHLKDLTFTLAKVDSYPTGDLGSYDFLFTFDSKHGVDIGRIKSLLGPEIVLIGAYSL